VPGAKYSVAECTLEGNSADWFFFSLLAYTTFPFSLLLLAKIL